ncbi:MAG: SDR family NAD(P)-dependent oxidoreductase [Acidimicrobiia bacterium]|nr:SDR family NAD(P)-dependent oxidoreductase [Acidimicrobiia bacterium]MDH5290557.1 SDR family NAD(P)-dependent oxidoreductase [Acidimicrobiia bacterium]
MAGTNHWPPPGWRERFDEAPVAVVTGASSGLGLVMAQALVAAGAVVVLGCRDQARGERAAALCGTGSGARRGAGGRRAIVGDIDLARPDSVEGFARWFTARHNRLDLLVNNAGVMGAPPTLTPEGIELHWATNHLGPFALVGRLLDVLAAAPGSRVVAVASVAAGDGRLSGRDPTSLTGYRWWPAYAASKLANLVFARELDRRLRAAGLPVVSLAAHPGVTHTNLVSTRFAGSGPLNAAGRRVALAGSRLVLAPASSGAQPILRAATDPGAGGGSYWGPSGFRQYRGRPVLVEPPPSAADPALGPAMWAESVRLTGVDYLS